MSGVSGPLALSSLIASFDRKELERLVAGRKVASPLSVNDVLDLAAELLKPDSIFQALAALPRDELRALAEFTEGELEPLKQLGLVGRGPGPSHELLPLPEVRSQLETMLKAQGVSAEDLRTETHVGSSTVEAGHSSSDFSAWYTSALTASGQVAWLLRDLARFPARLNRNGGVPSAWVKTISERLGIEQAGELVWLMEVAGLTVSRNGTLVASNSQWLETSHEERWIALARAGIMLMPPQMLGLLANTGFGASVTDVSENFPREYPLAPQSTVDTIARTVDLWERIGLTVRGQLSNVGSALVSHHAATDLPDLGFPAPVPGVYVQPDLSVIVPGLLKPSDEAELAALTLPEQIGVASTLRFSEATLGEAFDQGVTSEYIRSLLDRLSLTGIPQPLDYLLTALAARAGSVRVSIQHSDAGRTRIDFARPEIRTTMLVDRHLAHLQLQEVPEAEPGTAPAPLFSRLRADHVLAALVDARYPAVAVDAVAPVVPAPAAQEVLETQEHVEPTDLLTALVDRVLEANEAGPSDIGRLVTLAIRDKTSLRVTVEIRGESRDFTILPISLAAGRMRALDEAAGVERTLPLDAITHISQELAPTAG